MFWRGRIIVGLLLTAFAFARAEAETHAPELGAGPQIAVMFEVGSEGAWRHIVTGFANAVAEDLDVELEIISITGGPANFVRHVEKLLAREDPPDYLVLPEYKASALRTVSLADAAEIPVFLFNTAPNPSDRDELGAPRTKYKSFIGEMYPDDKAAGYELARYLIQSAQRDGAGEVNVIALAGNSASRSARLRSLGLRRAVEESANTELLQEVSGRWRRHVASMKAPPLLARHPHANVYWAANDAMALGISDAIGDIVPNAKLGGIDWTAQALDAIREGRLDASAGGHFMEAGWAIILLHDHFHGADFAKTPGGASRTTPFYLITKETVHTLDKVIGPEFWGQVDFRTFSRVHNPTRDGYDFSYTKLIAGARRAH